MALKALDQRLANSSSPVGSNSTNVTPAQARPTPAVGLARSDSVGSSQSPPSNGRPLERTKSASDAEEAGKAKSDIR